MCAIAYDGEDHRISSAITILTIIMTIRVPIRFCCLNPKKLEEDWKLLIHKLNVEQLVEKKCRNNEKSLKLFIQN